MRSALYKGWVRHRRNTPVINHFRYPLFMLCLDLDELDHVFAGRWLWSTARPALARFRRSDYLGDERTPLKQAVLDTVENTVGRRPAGPVHLLTHLRYYGYGFNPVSFYFCYGADGETIEAIIAEITNTPWGEKYPYVLQCGSPDNRNKYRFEFSKQFHVSPFMGMDQHYAWQFSMQDDNCVIHMKNYEADSLVFDATLNLNKRAITGPSLARVLVEFPMMTVQVIIGIYWQALKLWLKGCMFYTHPDKLQRDNEPL